MSQIQPSALSPQPSALSPQPSALSLRSRLACVVFALVLPVVHAQANTQCTLFPFITDGSNNPLYVASTPQGAIDKWVASGTDTGLKCSKNGLLVPMTVKWRVTGATHTSGAWTDHEIGVSGLDYYPNGDLNSACRDVYIVFGFSTEYIVSCTEVANRNLSLSIPTQDPKDPYPAGIAGKKSSIDLIAKVTDGGTPKAGVAVSFGVEPIANSGGHDHHDASRPKGLVNGALTANGVTDGNGEIKVTFQADQVAGTHVVSAVCDSCTNKSVTKSVDVKVPDLVSLQAGRGYTLEGNTSAVGVNHKGNHYFTESARNNLQKLIDHFNSFGWQPVGINDASLVWGGKFDSKGFWTTGFHDEHRIGEEVDIGFITGTNASKITKGYYEVCREKKIEVPSTILWHDIPISQGGKYAPHFHVRLSGTYTKGAAAGKYAKCDSDSKTK